MHVTNFRYKNSYSQKNKSLISAEKCNWYALTIVINRLNYFVHIINLMKNEIIRGREKAKQTLNFLFFNFFIHDKRSTRKNLSIIICLLKVVYVNFFYCLWNFVCLFFLISFHQIFILHYEFRNFTCFSLELQQSWKKN